MLGRSTRQIASTILKAPLKNRLPMCVVVRDISVGKPQYKHGIHRSNAEELVNKVPVIEVEGYTAVCDGGSGALGHPLEYIQLHTVSDKPQVCKYCGLRYISKGPAHH
mmetsp:Transcript_18708/g.20339  ORF Transcript_18708/g.20339 Transcript_18708/m.20339 type:complete len:108 (+) Transcript_18708:70-393(+)|eukprot:gene9399-10208_t